MANKKSYRVFFCYAHGSRQDSEFFEYFQNDLITHCDIESTDDRKLLKGCGAVIVIFSQSFLQSYEMREQLRKLLISKKAIFPIASYNPDLPIRTKDYVRKGVLHFSLGAHMLALGHFKEAVKLWHRCVDVSSESKGRQPGLQALASLRLRELEHVRPKKLTLDDSILTPEEIGMISSSVSVNAAVSALTIYEEAQRLIQVNAWERALDILEINYDLGFNFPDPMGAVRIKSLTEDIGDEIDNVVHKLARQVIWLTEEEQLHAIDILTSKILDVLRDKQREQVVMRLGARCSGKDASLQTDRMTTAFRSIIGKLKKNQASQPTKYEQVLQLYLEQNSSVVNVEDILALFPDSEDRNHAAVSLINRLNKKLEPYHLRIKKLPQHEQSVYGVIEYFRVPTDLDT